VRQDDGLLASTPIVRELWREWGSVVEVARFSRQRAAGPLPEAWQPWGLQSGKRPTECRLVVSFHGDPQELDFEQRTKLRLAKALAGEPLPYAMLI
jgi:hypothetical protein